MKSEPDSTIFKNAFEKEHFGLVPINKLQIKFESKEVRLDIAVVDREGHTKEMMSLYCEEVHSAVIFLKAFYKIQHYYKSYLFGQQSVSATTTSNTSIVGMNSQSVSISQ